MQTLNDFVLLLERKKLLHRIKEPVSTFLEITEIHRRILNDGGPALLFENVYNQHGQKNSIPVLTNLYGTTERVALALGYNNVNELRSLGEKLAFLRQPKPPSGLKESLGMIPLIKNIMNMKPKTIKKGRCQEVQYTKNEIDIGILPIQTCWPNEPAPLITWGLVVTCEAPDDMNKNNIKLDNYNIGIYRLQVIDKEKLIVRWLKHRGGAAHYRSWQKKYTNNKDVNKNKEADINQNKMPIAIVIGCDTLTTLSAVMPIPDTISEYNFSGLLRNKSLELVNCLTVPLKVPANAEIIIEGFVDLTELADEGPYGDHTGFYNSVEKFPVIEITAITTAKKPIYLTTYTGKPPDEPSVLGAALNEIFIPLLTQQFKEIVDFWLPPEACSYRIAIVSIRKSYPGHAKRIMMAIWSYLQQFTYTKFIIVVDHSINVRSWADIMWAVSTHVDFKRDVVTIENTPMDYLDFASVDFELGAKIGFDATTKIESETKREWGKEIIMDEDIVEMVKAKWEKYGFKT